METNKNKQEHLFKDKNIFIYEINSNSRNNYHISMMIDIMKIF